MPDFGSDLSCVFDLESTCAPVTGRTLLAQAIARRLITPRGRLIDDPNYGTDLTNMINADMSQRDISALIAAIRAEVMKDERVAAVTVKVTPPPKLTGTYEIAIGLTDADGPFVMTVAASSVTLELLKVGE